MMISKTLLKSHALLGQSPADVLKEVNNRICANNQAEMFVTVWLGILEISTGKLTAANAGHEYPVIKRADGNFELFKDKHGFVLGGMEDTRYKEYTIELGKGDKIFLYTDGVPEATDSQEQMFGTDRMLAALNSNADVSPEQLLKNARSAVNSFVKEAEQFDDLTMMCVEYKGTEPDDKTKANKKNNG
jgi:sigma-B regulation protein RsbU (phosphoserine phosphatase)